MASFAHLSLGTPIPPSPHAVSCSLPTMRAVRGYEEKDPAILSQLANGYPRFVVHPFAKQLAAHFITTTPALAGRHLWLTSSAAMAPASCRAAAARSASGRGDTRSRTRSRAQRRLTAVGRVALSCSKVCEDEALALVLQRDLCC